MKRALRMRTSHSNQINPKIEKINSIEKIEIEL